MAISLSGKTALITGASRGIGEAAARIMAGYGANVVLAARSTRDTARIAAEIGDRAVAVTCDVAQYVDVENAVAEAVRNFGSLDILPIHPRAAEPAHRILVRGRKGTAGPLRILPGLVLHGDGGNGFTTSVEAMLREGRALSSVVRAWHGGRGNPS